MELDVHTNYCITRHLFWNVALKHGRVSGQKAIRLRGEFAFSGKSEARYLSDETYFKKKKRLID